jgi:hypothetical protein
VSWDVDGQATLESEPPLAGLGQVEAQGNRVLALTQSTTFKMSATKNNSTEFRRQEVKVISIAGAETLQLAGQTCQGKKFVALAQVPAASWPQPIAVDTVTLQSDMPARLRHGAGSADLVAAKASSAFAGQAFGGDWQLEIDDAGPNCANAPDPAFVRVILRCGP